MAKLRPEVIAELEELTQFFGEFDERIFDQFVMAVVAVNEELATRLFVQMGLTAQAAALWLVTRLEAGNCLEEEPTAD